MPTYDYRCPECAAEQTVERPMTNSESIICTSCNTGMNKIYSAIPNINVKGLSSR